MAKPGPQSKRISRTCQVCGNVFDAVPSAVAKGHARFCSRECWGRSRSVPHIRRECKQCGKEFYQEACKVKAGIGLFCSRTCSDQGHKKRTKRQNRFVCQCCGKVFVSASSQRTYCSTDCKGKASRKPVRKAKPTRDWGHIRWAIAVILRDKKCIRCEARENLQAHHVQSWRNAPSLRYDVNNGVSLCPHCHHSQHPHMSLDRFIRIGGKTVRHCVVCEAPYLVRPKHQQVCGHRCGQLLSHRRRKEQRT